MATFVERVDEESNYRKLLTVIKEGFKDGEIFNRRLVAERYMQKYEIQNIGEVNHIIKQEFERIITNLRYYSKVRILPNGQYVLCFKKKAKEEQVHPDNVMAI